MYTPFDCSLDVQAWKQPQGKSREQKRIFEPQQSRPGSCCTPCPKSDWSRCRPNQETDVEVSVVACETAEGPGSIVKTGGQKGSGTGSVGMVFCT